MSVELWNDTDLKLNKFEHTEEKHKFVIPPQELTMDKATMKRHLQTQNKPSQTFKFDWYPKKKKKKNPKRGRAYTNISF